jgi:putative endonuclease
MFNPFNNKIFGKAGESIAVKYLQKKGYEILEQNFRTKMGEIDIIARQNERVIFVEVKRRSSGRFGKGYEAVGWHKQQQIIKVAHYYIKINELKVLCRFDVISIDGEEIKHIENAFGVKW